MKDGRNKGPQNIIMDYFQWSFGMVKALVWGSFSSLFSKYACFPIDLDGSTFDSLVTFRS